MASRVTKLKIKKGDMVKIIAGAGKGNTGTVLEVDSTHLQIKVEGHAMKTHYDRQTGISQKEGFIDYSNVALANKVKKAAPKKAATKKTTAKKTATKKATKKKTTKKKS